MFVSVWITLAVIAAGISYLTLRRQLDEVIFSLFSAGIWVILALGATNLEMDIGGGIVYQQSHESVAFVCVGFAGLMVLTMLLGTGTFIKQTLEDEQPGRF